MLVAAGDHGLCAYVRIFLILYLFFVPNFLSFSYRTQKS